MILFLITPKRYRLFGKIVIEILDDFSEAKDYGMIDEVLLELSMSNN